MKNKTSPVYVAVFLYRFAFVLFFIPLQRVVSAGTSLPSAIHLYRINILAIPLICVWAVLCYNHIKYSSNRHIIRTDKGVLLKHSTENFMKNSDFIRISANPLFRLLSVCRLQITASHSTQTLYLNKKESYRIIEKFFNKSKSPHREFKSSFLSVLIFSVSFSSALTGLLSAIPLLRNIAGILGEEQTNTILSNADLWVVTGYTALPPFLRILSTLILLAWTTGATIEFLRYYPMKIRIHKNFITTEKGLLTKHLTCIKKTAISAVIIRQSILLYLLRLYTIETIIKSERKEESVPLLLATDKNKCEKLLLCLTPRQSNRNLIKPPQKAFLSYVYKPLLFISALSVFYIITENLSPYKIEIHLMLFVTLWLCLWFIFSAVAFFRCGIYLCNSQLVISTTDKLNFIRVHIPKDKIKGVKITQNIFQRRKGLCNLYIYLLSGHRKRILIKHTDKNKTAGLFKL